MVIEGKPKNRRRILKLHMKYYYDFGSLAKILSAYEQLGFGGKLTHKGWYLNMKQNCAKQTIITWIKMSNFPKTCLKNCLVQNPIDLLTYPLNRKTFLLKFEFPTTAKCVLLSCTVVCLIIGLGIFTWYLWKPRPGLFKKRNFSWKKYFILKILRANDYTFILY